MFDKTNTATVKFFNINKQVISENDTTQIPQLYTALDIKDSVVKAMTTKSITIKKEMSYTL